MDEDIADLIKRTKEHIEFYEGTKNYSMVKYLERILYLLKDC